MQDESKEITARKELLPAKNIIDYYESLLMQNGIFLSPSTAVILRSTIHYLKGSSPDEHYKQAAKIIGDVVAVEMNGLSQSVKDYIGDKIVTELKNNNLF